jgi:PGF-CTERM protein
VAGGTRRGRGLELREVRTAIEITVPEDLRDEPATIRVSVDADEIETSPEQVVIERYDAEADTWTELETTPVETGGDVVELEAETPGFSLFAVTEADEETTATQTAAETTMTDSATPEDDTTPTADSVQTSISTTETGTPGFGLGVAIVAVLGAALVAVRRK